MARTGEFDKPCANGACPYASEQLRTYYVRTTGRPYSRCVECSIEYEKERYWGNPEARRAKVRARYERNVEEMRRRDRERYPARKESMAAYLHCWRKKNRSLLNMHEVARQARIKGAVDSELIDREYIYKRDGGVCHICEEHVEESAFTLDHLIPLSRGGPHTHVNLRVAHRSCNSRMGVARIPAQLLLFG